MVSHFLWDEYPIFLSKTSPEKELTKKTSYAADCFSLADLTAPWNTSGATQTREFVEWSESLIAHAPFISSSSSSSSSGYTMKTFFPASISKQGQISRAKTSLAEFPSTSQARNDLEIIKVLGIEYFLVNSNSSPRYTADEINRLLKLCGESLLTNKQIKEYTLKKCFRVTSA
jgi:hypothetical protein